MPNSHIFEITHKIIEDSEAYILNYPSQTKVRLWLSKSLIFPFNFLLLGAGEIFKPFVKWFFMSAALLALWTFVVTNTNLQPEIVTVGLSICIYLPMALVIFAVPSGYAYYGVRKDSLNGVVKYLSKLDINSVEMAELIEDNLTSIYARVISRTSTYKWIVGSFWALFAFILNQQIRIVSTKSPENLASIINDNIIVAIAIIISTFFAVWLIASYKRASELLFKSIEFGLVELKHKLNEEKLKISRER